MIEYLVVLLTGLIVGGTLVWVTRSETIRVLREQLDGARKAEATATDRLVHAWHEGAQIPPRPPEAPPEALQPLPRDLADHVKQWDDPEHRALLEADIRTMLGRGLSPVAVLMHLDNQHPT